jgi:exodeoxyribonuclease VII large subunit
VRDLFRVLQRRNAGIDLVILPTPVQGPDAAARIAQQIRTADQWQLGEVIVVTRGGGSLEDLLPFSDERVLRAIAAARTPVISAIGHDVDSTLSDLVADHHAPTPSAAAETVAAAGGELLRRVRGLRSEMTATLAQRCSRARLLLDQFVPARLEQNARRVLDPLAQRVDDANELLQRQIRERLLHARHAVELSFEKLQASSPLAILERGYALVTSSGTGHLVTDANQVAEQAVLDIRLHRGALQAVVVAAPPTAPAPRASSANQKNQSAEEIEDGASDI